MPPRKKGVRKCSICGRSFPAEAIKTYNGKNYCEKCEAERKQQSDDLVTLRDYIKLKMNPDNDLWPLISKQIKQYREEYEMTYSGMYATLKFLFEYSDDEFNYNIESGIAFLPFWYRTARLFFHNMKEVKSSNSEEKIKECLGLSGNYIVLKRSELVEEDKKFLEKKRKEEQKCLLNLDDVEDDGIIVDDFYYIDKNLFNKNKKSRRDG